MTDYYDRLQDELDGIRPTKAGSNPERCKHGMLPGQCGPCNRLLEIGAPSKPTPTRAKRERKAKVPRPKPAIRTMAQFRKRMRDVARDAKGDGFEIEQVAGDLADCQRYDADVMDFVRRKFPWAKTRLQVVELLADYIVG